MSIDGKMLAHFPRLNSMFDTYRVETIPKAEILLTPFYPRLGSWPSKGGG